jgi:hypothetical protein
MRLTHAAVALLVATFPAFAADLTGQASVIDGEARIIGDAERADPGITRRTLDGQLAADEGRWWPWMRLRRWRHFAQPGPEITHGRGPGGRGAYLATEVLCI